MKKLLATAALLTVLAVSPAFAAPSVTEMVTQAQTMATENPAGAAAMLEQIAAQASTITPEQAAAVAAALQSINTWTQTGCGAAGAAGACASIFTSLLTISSTPNVTASNPNLYSVILTNAQQFTNNAPKDNKKVADLEGFVQLALSNPNPTNNALPPLVPTND